VLQVQIINLLHLFHTRMLLFAFAARHLIVKKDDRVAEGVTLAFYKHHEH